MKQPDNYVALLRRAREQVESSPLYRRFINGTPLENDIAVWMATFAAEVRIESIPNPEEVADLRARLDAAEQERAKLFKSVGVGIDMLCAFAVLHPDDVNEGAIRAAFPEWPQ